jgi:hypothetical protein
MKLLDVPWVNASEIRRHIDAATGRPEKLVEWPAGRRLASRIEVSVAEDGMSAAVCISPPKRGAAPPTVERVAAELGKVGVVFGVDQEAIHALLEGNTFDEWVVVAQGRRPVDAKAGEVQYHFNTNRGKPYLEMDFGRINLKELNFIENRKRGNLLAELLPPVAARNGSTVTGVTIPANTQTSPVQLRVGKNVVLNPEKTLAFADTDGNVRLTGEVLIVEPVVTVENVNYETGNIHLDGSLVVEKEIADGFEVDVTGDIQVGRGVGKAALRAGGNILLKTGINGNAGGTIVCGGNLFAKYIESSTVSVRGNVFVEEAIMHSSLSVWRHCILNGRRAEIIASSLTVGGSTWCKKLGSVYESPTHVAVGVHPSVLQEFRDTKRSLDQLQDRFGVVETQLEQLERAYGAGHHEDKVVRAREQLETEKASLAAEISRARHRLSEIRHTISASRESMLVVEDTMYKGAVVVFGVTEYRAPDNGARKTVLHPGEEGIVESGFNPYDPPTLRFEEEEEEEDDAPADDAADRSPPPE